MNRLHRGNNIQAPGPRLFLIRNFFVLVSASIVLQRNEGDSGFLHQSKLIRIVGKDVFPSLVDLGLLEAVQSRAGYISRISSHSKGVQLGSNIHALVDKCRGQWILTRARHCVRTLFNTDSCPKSCIFPSQPKAESLRLVRLEVAFDVVVIRRWR